MNKLKQLFLMLFVTSSIMSFSQVEKFSDTIYYDSNWDVSDKSNYKYYRTFSESTIKYQNKNLIQITDYYKTGQKQMIGYKKSLESKEKIGLYTFYKKNGKIDFMRLYKFHETIDLFNHVKKYLNEVQKNTTENIDFYVSFFSNGHVEEAGYISSENLRIGKWKRYNPYGKKIYKIIEYVDNCDIISKKTFYPNHKIWKEEFYEYNMKEGVWKYYNSDGVLIKEKVYKNDILIEKNRFKT